MDDVHLTWMTSRIGILNAARHMEAAKVGGTP
jgi:hypothetical protein